MEFYTPPIDYAGMQPQHDLAGTFGKGFEIGDAIQNSIFGRKKEEAALERQNTMQERTHAVFTNPNATAKDIGGLALEFPEIAEHVGQAWKMMDEGKKEEHLKTYVPAYAAILNGKNDVAIKLMRDKAAAHRNSGDEQGAADNEDFADMIEQNPEQARNMGGMYLAAGLGADKFIDKFTGLNSEYRAQSQEGRAQTQELRNQAEEQRKKDAAPIELSTKLAEMTEKQNKANNSGVVEEAKASQEQSKANKDAIEASYAEETAQATINEKNASTDKKQAEANAKNAKPEDDGFINQGMPRPKRVPWANVNDSKQRDILKGRVYSASEKKLEQDRTDAQALISSATDAKRFMELNNDVATGGFIDNTSTGRYLGSVAGSDAYKEMQTITARLAPAQRVPGTGATSDYDAKMFERGTLNVSNKGNVNKSIANAIIARAENTKDYISFKQDYLQQNGTLAGADQYWREYSEKNPILDPEKPNSYTLNPKRVSYENYFSGDLDTEKPQAAPAPAATTPKVESASRTPSMKAMAEKMGLTDAQLDAFLKKNGH